MERPLYEVRNKLYVLRIIKIDEGFDVMITVPGNLSANFFLKNDQIPGVLDFLVENSHAKKD